VAVLCREAQDGAARCLLDYTLERTTAANKDAAQLEISQAALSAKASEITSEALSLRTEVSTRCSAVANLIENDILGKGWNPVKRKEMIVFLFILLVVSYPKN
jgi:hypothetical protein